MNTAKRKQKPSRSSLLLTLAIVLVAILLATVLLKHWITPDDTPTPGTSTDPITVAEVSVDAITSIVVTDGEATQSYAFSNAQWSLSENSTYPLDKEAMTAFATACAKIVASAKVADITAETALADFGLLTPYTVTVITGTTSYTVELGKKYTYGNSYYFRIRGNDVLYRMNGSDALALRATLHSLTYGADLPDIFLSDLHTATITFGTAENAAVTTLTEAEHANLLSGLFSAVNTIDTKRYADTAPTEEARATYGLLGTQTRILTLTQTRTVAGPTIDGVSKPVEKTESFTFQIGNTVTVNINGADRTLAYVQIPGQPYVYYMDITVLNTITPPATNA